MLPNRFADWSGAEASLPPVRISKPTAPVTLSIMSLASSPSCELDLVMVDKTNLIENIVHRRHVDLVL